MAPSSRVSATGMGPGKPETIHVEGPAASVVRRWFMVNHRLAVLALAILLGHLSLEHLVLVVLQYLYK